MSSDDLGTLSDYSVSARADYPTIFGQGDSVVRDAFGREKRNRLKARILAAIAESGTPVEWVVFDAGSVNVVDSTRIQKVDELNEELAARNIVFAIARKEPSAERFFGRFVGECAQGASNGPQLSHAEIRDIGV